MRRRWRRGDREAGGAGRRPTHPVQGAQRRVGVGREQFESAPNGAAATTNAAVTRVTTAAPTGGTTAGDGSGNGLAAAERQIVDAQQNVDAALAAVQTALASASTACGVVAPTPTPTRTPTGAGHGGGSTPPSSASASASATSTSTSTSTPTSTSVPVTTKPATAGLGTAACIAAQRTVLTAEQTLSSMQTALARAEQAFEKAAGSTSSAAPSTNTGNGSSSSSSSPTSSGGSTVSAAQLVADQAAVDAAAVDVLAAQQSVQEATVTTPIAGTVVALSLQTGKAVTASSSTATIVVAGSGGYEISTTVGVNDIGKVKVGQSASVVPDGGTTSLVGSVVWIGAASGNSSSTSYPVVIGLKTTETTLHSGALASTSIELAHTTAAITVPTSAVHTTNGLHVVAVLGNDKTSSVVVRVGVVGATATQITSGLQAGQVVVLADLHAPVPSSNTSTRVANALTGGNGNSNGVLGGRGLGG